MFGRRRKVGHFAIVFRRPGCLDGHDDPIWYWRGDEYAVTEALRQLTEEELRCARVRVYDVKSDDTDSHKWFSGVMYSLNGQEWLGREQSFWDGFWRRFR